MSGLRTGNEGHELTRRAVVSDFAWHSAALIPDPDTPKYHYPNGQGNPYAQLDPNAPVITESAYSA
jgi:hypothetical protein